MDKVFLFSIDLEDVRLWLPDGQKYKERVPDNTYKYLDWLNKINSKCTFFVTGNLAEMYPSLVKEIADEGHEIGCHTYSHKPLNEQTAETFREDIEKNLEALYHSGVNEIKGFRAPVLSITKNNSWAYSVLEQLGFTYSSSVLPAKNPLYGWEEFGIYPKRVSENFIEIPISVANFGIMTVPFIGGVYFRVLPWFAVKNAIKRSEKSNSILVGYFHPYDIDEEQERFMHPGINNSKFYNALMYYNRKGVFKRLNNIIERDYNVIRFSEFIESLSI